MASKEEQPIHPDDPGFLMSRRLDDDLTPEERRRLEALLSQDAEAERQMREYARLDQLLGEWGRAEPRVEWGRFQQGVLAEIRRRPAASRRTLNFVIRLGTPLAAAAAIALALWLPFDHEPDPAAMTRAFVAVMIERPPVATPWGEGDRAGAAPGIRVAFARERETVVEETLPTRRIMLGAVTRIDETWDNPSHETRGTY
ncbi:MAG: hypothetical protein IT449_04205 [Phycisphaerales bacterium]|nr:hypothetical protein [Phycisphaerales bacterium]